MFLIIKKIIKISIIVIFLNLFLNKKIYAYNFIKYEKNPIIKNDYNTNWKKLHVSAPFVIYDKNEYKMWHSAYNGNFWSIGLSISRDKINWTDYYINPVLVPNNDGKENHVSTPSIIKNNNNEYFMYYTASPDDASYFEIRLAKSLDGINWEKYSTPVIKGETEKEFNVANPGVLIHNNKYHMWYSAASKYSTWKIHYAYSEDGINWTKYLNNPLNLPNLGHLGAPDIKFYNNKFHMFYHTGIFTPQNIYYVVSNDGINWSCENTNCNILTVSNSGWDSFRIVDPNLLIEGNNFYLYYGADDSFHWQIGLATYSFEEEKYPIILLPGIMASWNKSAIFYNQPVTIFDWKLLPFVKEYNGLINTFRNLGYQENQDFFVFPYDWRKSINQSSEDLKNFIETKIPQEKKVNLIGHSLGGLVARLFSQKNKEKVNKLITVGSPHQGAGQAYKAIEAGELESNNTWQWLAQKLLLQLYKDGIKTDKQIINDKLPVIKDLLPVYDFLKNTNDEVIKINNMTIKNELLLSYNSTINEIFPFLTTIIGESSNNTIWGYKVGPRTIFDRILDYYPDGRPINTIYDKGDLTVLSLSAKIGDNFETFNLNHGEIIYKKQAIKKILDILNISYEENQINESTETKIAPSLIFSLLSPATMSAIINQSIFKEYDGLIFIENAQNGDYQLKIVGNDKGNYKIIIGQITNNADYWNTIENQTAKDKIDSYLINFSQENPNEFFIDEKNTEKFKQNIINELISVNNPQNDNLTNAIKKLRQIKKSTEILIIHKHLFNALKEVAPDKKITLLSIIEKLEYFYNLIAQESKAKPKILENKIKIIEKKLNNLEKKLLKRKNNNEILAYQLLFYQQAKEKINKAKLSYQNKNYPFTEILIKTVEELIKKATIL